MFLKTGLNGWCDSGLLGYFETKKPECILISINMAIAWTMETGSILKLKYRFFLSFSYFGW